MDVNDSHRISIGASLLNMSNKNTMLSGLPPTTDDNEADVLNDETFGDCDLDTIKIKSDFGENGEFLGDFSSERLPDFFESDIPDEGGGGGISLVDNDNDQSQQPSIDALLGEDPMSMSALSMNLRQASMNPLFNMAISQASTPNHGSIFSQQPIPHMAPPPQQQQPQQINYQLLKQFEQMLINRQIPAHERIIYIQAMIEKMHHDTLNIHQPTTRLSTINGHDRTLNNNNLAYDQRERPLSMPIGEMMERARLSAMNINNSRSQSPTVANSAMSSQFMAAIQRSDQIPIDDNHHQQNRVNQTLSSSPLETIVSPSHHHHNQSRQNRPTKHYPRPPLLNTWQGRGSGHDEFAGMMNDREKQWVVKIQLHQASQTKEEDYYFHKWSQQKHHTQQAHGNQSNRHGHRGQRISYPVLQLLKSIQQENELAQRLSQTSTQATYSNVNPAHALPYALPLSTQLGKQSVATPRHPRCILHLDGAFSLGRRANAITHDKYTLGLLLNLENLYRDMLRLDNNTDSETSSVSNNTESKQLLSSIIDGYLNHKKYLFSDMFGQFKKGQLILECLYPYIKSTNHLESMFIRLYSSLSYMVRQWPTTFHIELSVVNTIHIMLQQVNANKSAFERLLTQVYIYYNEQIKAKLVEIDSSVLAGSSSPFSDPALFTNSFTVTILIELLLNLERHCYLLPDANSSNLPIQILQQLQPQLQYQLTEQVRLIVTDLCQALVACSSPLKKMLRPFAQAKHQQFGLLCKFLRTQISQQFYATLEPKLIFCCIKEN
ncbi:unnamed protein product [Rotaria magnacalcarata]|uniref:Uncharacterized protein n=4 Tax=Rotaria magnacalcarata TaxID=392030 RepID=A0A815M1J8_9BILA|nr:unnamed protein product [Rotaria magnacalcarata]CAF4383876.1 unnamed protein product [Rotaria magnacalcarata]